MDHNKSSIKFLSFSNDKEDAEQKLKLKEAAAKIEQAIAREKSHSELIDYQGSSYDDQSENDLANDTRSLFERLQEEKNKKKEAVDESQKLSNLVTTLDEDDINYLNEVEKNKREEEIKKRLEVYDALEAKKRLKEEKLQDEEQKMKASLTSPIFGSQKLTPTSSFKSRLSNLKVKPKMKPKEPKRPDELPAQQQTTEHPTRNKDNLGSIDDIQKNLTSDKKRIKTQDASSEKKPDTNTDSRLKCPCESTNVMRCVGILPSLPIVKKFPDSDEESDNSDDDLNGRIVPRIRVRKHK